MPGRPNLPVPSRNEMQMLTKSEISQNQAYHLLMKTLLLKGQIWGRSKQCTVMNVFFH